MAETTAPTPSVALPAGAEASVLFRAALDAAGVALAEAADALGTTTPRVSAKCHPGRDDVPATGRDALQLRDAGGKSWRAGLLWLTGMAQTFIEHPALAEVPGILRQCTVAVGDAARATAAIAVGGVISSEDRRSGERAFAALELLGRRGRAALGEERRRDAEARGGVG